MLRIYIHSINLHPVYLCAVIYSKVFHMLYLVYLTM